MSLLRSILFLILSVLFTAVFVSGLLFLFWLPPYRRHLASRPWAMVMMFFVRHVLCIKEQLIGRENIPAGACVVFCRHESAWETIGLQRIFLGAIFIMKRELHWIPFLGWGLAMNPMIAINRGAAREALMQVANEGKARLEAGYRVVIYPEGTRLAPGVAEPFKRGGAFMARKAGFPVVPVALNSGVCWRRNAFVKHPGTILVSVGPAIDPKGLSVDEINARAESWIRAELHRIDPAHYPAPSLAAEISTISNEG